MAKPIISKRCSNCKKVKPILEFYQYHTSKSGYQAYCKICHLEKQKEYSRTKQSKTIQKRFRQTEKGKANDKRYQQSKKGKATNKRFYIRHPEHRKAKSATNHAISAGRLLQPKTLQCSCGELAEQYHHHKGYAPEHWLDVIPVCVKCHGKIRLTS